MVYILYERETSNNRRLSVAINLPPICRDGNLQFNVVVVSFYLTYQGTCGVYSLRKRDVE